MQHRSVHRLTLLLLILASLFLCSCEDNTGSSNTAGGEGADVVNSDPIPASVRVEVVSAVIGPGKIDGTQWDGFGDLTEDLFKFAAGAAGLPAAQLLGKMGSAAVSSLGKPDPYGSVEIDRGNAGWSETWDVEKKSDSFQPLFSPNPSFQGVDITRDRIRVTLYDKDVSRDDDIGVVYLKPTDLQNVWRAGGDEWINVAGQTRGQLLLIRVLVTAD